VSLGVPLSNGGSFALFKISLVNILMSIAVLFSVSRSADASEPPIPILFVYTFQNLSITHPKQIPQSTVWQPLDSTKTSLKRVDGKALWIKTQISAAKSFRDPVIKFFRLQEKFAFFADGEKISSFGEGLKYAGLPVHLIKLPELNAEFTGYFRIESSLPLIGPRGGVFLGSRSEFVEELIIGDLTDLFIVSILALIGLVGFCLFVAYPQVRTYLFLGGFAVASGLYFVGRLPSKIIFGLDPVWSGYFGLCGLYATPVFFIGFFREIFSIQESKLFNKLGISSIVFFATALFLSFFTPSGPLDFLLIFYVIASLVYLAPLTYALTKLKTHPYVKTFYTGFGLMFLAGLWEVAREFRLFQANIPIITWGFFCFVLSLVVMQGQFFASLFQLSKENERLAEEARLRLERVLVCTRELSQSRNYKDLIRVVAEALLTELRISDQEVSIDFLMPSNSSEQTTENVHQFTYILSGDKSTSFLYEVSDNGESTQKNDRITSLPGINNALAHRHFKQDSNPASVLTIPLDSGPYAGAVIIRKFSDGSFESADFSLLSRFVNSMSASLFIALKNLEYVDEVKVKVAMESELDAAVSLQAALLPEPLVLPGLQYSAYCKSAGKTGGDWHGYYHCEKMNRLFLTIGDVTGHDFAASIMTGLAAGAVKAWEEHDSTKFDDAARAVEDLAKLVNKVFCASNRGLKYMSMSFACIELSNGRLHIVNAGHPNPFHFSPILTAKTLHAAGHLLGHDALSNFQAETYQLAKGDSLFFYTDGLFENHNNVGKCLSRRHFIKSVAGKNLAHDMLRAVLECAQDAWGDTPPDDDVTLVAVTWCPEEATRKNVA
jgi:serine phosphatase RsbU (regulator of sigma subunit)